LEALPEPDAPDAPGAPLHGARPLLAVVPGDAAVAAPAPPPAAAMAQRPCGVLAVGADCGAETSAPWGDPGCDGGHLQADGAPGGPGPSAPGPGAGAAAGAGGDAAAGRVALYSLRRHCYARELTFGGRVRPGACVRGGGRVRTPRPPERAPGREPPSGVRSARAELRGCTLGACPAGDSAVPNPYLTLTLHL